MVTVIAGTNSYKISSELKRLKSEFIAAHGDFGLESIDGEEASFERISEAVTSLPFLAGRKLVVLKNPQLNKQFAEKGAALLKAVPETTDVAVAMEHPDKRTALYKSLKQLPGFKEYNDPKEPELVRWLEQTAEVEGGQLSKADAKYLIARVGTNQMTLSNELNKLITYDPKITRETIENLTERTPQSTIFELLDAAFSGRKGQAIALYNEQRSLKVEPQQIIAMLAWQLHVLAVIKTASERSIEQIAQEAKLNPFVVRKSYGLAKKLTLKQLRQLVQRTLELDIKTKTQTIDADEALQHLLVTIP